MQYVGCFEVEQKQFLLGDPMATEIAAHFYKIRMLNMSKMRIDVICGLWNCYHVLDKTSSYPVALLMYHTQDTSHLNLKSFADIENEWNYEGKVCCSFSHTICAIDEKFYGNQAFAYTQYAESMLYQISELYEWCETTLEAGKNRTDLLSLLNKKKEKNEKYIEGVEISEYIGTHIPSIKVSTRWNADCVLRCDNQNISVSTIKGGVVSRCAADFSTVYTNEERSAIYISLDQGEPLFSVTDNNKNKFRVIH